MFGSRKSPLKAAKHNKINTEYPVPSHSNPFDSDDDLDSKKMLKPPRKTSLEPNLMTHSVSTNPFNNDEERGVQSSSSYFLTSAARDKYKNDFRDFGGVENQSLQELEDYSVYKAEETTKSVNCCLKIGEEMREDATKTLITLHQQGEQITRTHNVAVEVDHDLSRGEKLLGSLGGMFSRTWKPKKTRPITGPVITADNTPNRRAAHLDQREKLGLNPVPNGRSKTQLPSSEPTNALQKVEVVKEASPQSSCEKIEKAKQDDALVDLSNLLGELKEMAVDMGSEIDRQTKSLDHFQDDVDELNFRVRGANQRGRRLLGK